MSKKDISKIQINDSLYHLMDNDARKQIVELSGKLIDLEDYTAFEVFAHDYNISRDAIEENLGGDHIVKWQDIPACMTHRMRIRTGMIEHETSDVVVDWGDGSISTIANGEYLEKTTSVEDKESDYVLEHTYSNNGKYIVKIYGKNYYSVCTPSDPNNEEPKYNLICRILDNDLPLASCVTNISSLCAYAIRLFSVHVPSYFDLSRMTNIGGIFKSCKNLQSVKGLKNQFINVTAANQIFADCYSLTELEFTMPTSVSRGFSNEMFRNCIGYAGKIEDLIPAGGFDGGILGANYLFSECRKLTGTVPAEQFWNNRNVHWINTETAFLDCPAAIREQVPTSWGGTEDYGLLTMNKTGILNVVPISDDYNRRKNGYAGGTVSEICKLCGGNRYVICHNNDINDLYATDYLSLGSGHVITDDYTGSPTVPLEERIEKSDLEIEILFKVRSMFEYMQIDIPNYISWIGPMPDLEEGKTYIINILNWEAVCIEYTPGVTV